MRSRAIGGEFLPTRTRNLTRRLVCLLSLSVIVGLVLCSVSLAANSSPAVSSKAWSRPQIDPNPPVQKPTQMPLVYKAEPRNTAAAVTIPNNPDRAVTTATNTTQSENSIYVSPTNPQNATYLS